MERHAIMTDIKILGPGCKRCQATETMVKDAAARLGLAVTIEKVTDFAEIARYGIAATPGIVIDGTVVHAGGLPKEADIDRWLNAAA